MGQRHDDEDEYDFRQRRPGRRFSDGDDRDDRPPVRRGDGGTAVLVAGALVAMLTLAVGGAVLLFWATPIAPRVAPPNVAVAEEEAPPEVRRMELVPMPADRPARLSERELAPLPRPAP